MEYPTFLCNAQKVGQKVKSGNLVAEIIINLTQLEYENE